MNTIDPSKVAQELRESVKNTLATECLKLKIVGFLVGDNPASITYANYTKDACIAVGIEFDLIKLNRIDLENEIVKANDDDDVHGIFIYYPIFNNEQDTYLKNLVSPKKDIEGLTMYWNQKLYQNKRFDDEEMTIRSLVPCTPLAIEKLLYCAGISEENKFSSKTVTIFNRSEVVGRPLAHMLSNDSAKVYSFDEDGPLLFEDGKVKEVSLSREEALKLSDIVITGVPSRSFNKVKVSELKDDVICLNFSAFANFEESVKDHAKVFIPRVGPLTVAMCLNNALHLYKSFHG